MKVVRYLLGFFCVTLMASGFAAPSSVYPKCPTVAEIKSVAAFQKAETSVRAPGLYILFSWPFVEGKHTWVVHAATTSCGRNMVACNFPAIYQAILNNVIPTQHPMRVPVGSQIACGYSIVPTSKSPGSIKIAVTDQV